MKKLSNILFFLIIILGCVIIYLSSDEESPITPKNLPIKEIQKIEFIRNKDKQKVIITNKFTIDSLISSLYQSKKVDIRGTNVAKGLYLFKIYYRNDTFELLGLSQSIKPSEGIYIWRGSYLYKNDNLFNRINDFF